MKLTKEQAELAAEALFDRGGDLRRWAWRDGDDLRVRGEAMHELRAQLQAYVRELEQDDADTAALNAKANEVIASAFAASDYKVEIAYDEALAELLEHDAYHHHRDCGERWFFFGEDVAGFATTACVVMRDPVDTAAAKEVG